MVTTTAMAMTMTMTTTMMKLPARRPRKEVNKSKRRPKFFYRNMGDDEEDERLHTSFAGCLNQMSE